MTEMVKSQQSLIAGVVLSFLLLAGTGAGDARADDAAQTYENALAAYNRGDLPGALPLFRQAAEDGSADAQAWLGYLLDLAEENTESVRWYRAAAEQGHKDGLAGLADMYAKGEGVEKNLAEARSLYEKAADAGQDRAARVLANAYEKGGLDVEPDPGKAMYWTSRAEQLAAGKEQE
jgi:TPR repeat protein